MYVCYNHQVVYCHTQILFNWVLYHARKAVQHHENMRFSRSKLFGVYRELFRAIGSSMVALGLLQDRQMRRGWEGGGEGERKGGRGRRRGRGERGGGQKDGGEEGGREGGRERE